MAHKSITTSYLVGNLHCPSCVAVIKNVLQAEYQGRILWVSPNVVTSVVTVEHRDDGAGLIRDMGKTLEDVGFDICAVDTTAPDVADETAADIQRARRASWEGHRRRSGTLGLWWRLWRGATSSSSPPSTPHNGKAATHLDNCDACRTVTAAAPNGNGLSLGQSPRLVSLSASSLQNLLKPDDPDGQTRSSSLKALEQVVVAADDQDTSPRLWRATLSIGGMSCASCSNTVTEQIKKYPWVASIVVNLVANSATVDLKDASRTQDLVDAINNLGYHAALDKVIDLRELKRASADQREVEIQIDGIFCSKCPERISMTLRNLSTSRIEILKTPSLEKPLLKIRYAPRAPSFTIRRILKAIEATDPSLQASIYHAPTLEERSKAIRNQHQNEMLWRMTLTLVVAVPTFVLGIVYMSLVPDSDQTRHFLTEPWKSGLSRLQIMLFVLSTPVYFFAADIFHARAIKEIQTMWRPGSRTPLTQRFYKFGSMNMLMSLGTTIAYFSSVAQMISAGLRHEESVPDSRFYFDSVVFLTLFLLAGRLIESYSKSKTGDAVGALAKLRPSTAPLIDKDESRGQVTTTSIPVDQLETGDGIRVLHGASPATDGVVMTGETIFDESSLTGESRPIKKSPGDEVYAGTMNKGDAISIRVTGTSGKSMLDQIVDAVREGQTKRAPVEQIADTLTSYFVPVITLIAVLTWVVWLSLASTGVVSKHELESSGGAVAFAFQFAIAVFVVACPCGLALAAPTAIFVGGGIAANHGILAKGGGEAFEKASKVDCVVFDKTGTLTDGGEPKITDSELFPHGPVDGLGKQTLLAALRAVEEHSSHPIAKAIVHFCGSEAAPGPAPTPAELERVQELPGRGMRADCKSGSFQVAVGNELLMRDLSVTLAPNVAARLQSWKGEAKSVAVVAVKRGEDDSPWKPAAILSISDPVRVEAVSVIRALREARGTQVWMLSGDNATTAKAVARRVGIDETNVLAEVLPSEKADKVRYLQATLGADDESIGIRRRPRRLLDLELGLVLGRRSRRPRRRATVAMVGDGINDSPALTAADVGIAIGSGSDVAISSADFVLASSSLGAVLTLLDLSRTVFRRIKINFGWALIYNLVAVPIAAGCLYAIKTGEGSHVRLDPVWAALAMALSSISVVLSSLSLRARVPWLGFRYKPVVVSL